MTVFARTIAFVLACGLLVASLPGIGDAQSATAPGSITGTLLDKEGGIPLSKASVSLYQGSTRVQSTATNPRGVYSFTGLSPGVYFATYQLTGYGLRRSDDIAITSGANITLQTLIGREATSQSSNSLRTIGTVSASARTGGGSLATSTTINSNVSSDLIERQGYTRIGDALQTLPGVNLTGLSSSIGDDLGVDIRGFGGTETESLLDGHPIGPQGVGGNSYGYQLSPSYTIANTQVTYGSGALGLYGTDAIGGTVDMQTIEPTRENHALFTQGVGYQGRRYSDAQLTGSVLDQKLGYVLVHAVDGTYGPYKSQARLQPGLLGGDFSSANQAANTYTMSQDYLLRSDLFKLRYNFTPKTSFTATAFDSSSFDDKSGNGDNCYNTYGLQLYNAQQASLAPSTYNVGPLKGDCPAGLLGATFDQKTFTCITPSQYAANSYGLNGGGPGPFQAHRFHDYHGRIQSVIGNNTVTIDGFGNRYSTDYNRAVASGAFHTDFYDTTGLLISDDIASRSNTVGFGYFVQHQNHQGTYVDPSVSPFLNVGVNSTPGLSYATGIRNFFLRDQYTPPGPFSAFLNAWLKRDTLTQKQSLDPRLSFVLRPSPRDVVRLTGGRSNGQPAPELVAGPPNFNTTPENITANCGGLTSIGTTANPLLNSETSYDYEVGYGHRFGGDNVINVNGYYAFEKNRIFGGDLTVSQIPSLLALVPQTLLNAYFDRINKQCSTSNAGLAQLSFTTNYNASAARYQGLEFNGRYRLDPHLFVDYTGDIQSAVNLGVPAQVLSNSRNTTLINGQQIQGIALQKYSAGLDYTNNRGFETRIDGYYIGPYNGYNRDPFFYANASITKDIGHGVSFNIGVLNLFDSQASTIAVKGTAPFQGENQFGSDTSAIQQNSSIGNLQTGLLPITAVFSITARI